MIRVIIIIYKDKHTHMVLSFYVYNSKSDKMMNRTTVSNFSEGRLSLLISWFRNKKKKDCNEDLM